MNILRTLHAWVGVGLALLLILIALTGTVSVFRGQIVRATLPAARAAAPNWTTYGPALAAFEAAEPGRLQSVKFSPYGLGAHRAFLAGGEGAFLAADGRVAQRWRGRPRVEEAILSLHHELLAGGLGGRAVGVAGLLGLCMVLSGLVLWTPARRLFAPRLLPRSSARRDLLPTHRDLGLILAVFLLVQFGTGAGMVFEGPLRKLLQVPPEALPAPPASQPEGPADWPKIIAAAHAVFPNGAVRRAAAPGRRGGLYAVSIQQAGDINPEGGSRVLLDARGAVVGVSDILKRPAGAQVVNALLGVHSGAYAEPASLALLTATGLGLAWLSGLGGGAFLRRSGRRARRRADPSPAS